MRLWILDQYTHLVVFPEPIDVEYFGHLDVGWGGLHWQPVLQVVSKVVSEKRPHGKRVVHDFLTLVLGGCGGLRLHGSTNVDAMLPVKCLVHQRYASRSSAPEQYGVDWHSLRGLPICVDNRTLFGWCAKPIKRMRVFVIRQFIKVTIP